MGDKFDGSKLTTGTTLRQCNHGGNWRNNHGKLSCQRSPALAPVWCHVLMRCWSGSVSVTLSCQCSQWHSSHSWSSLQCHKLHPAALTNINNHKSSEHLQCTVGKLGLQQAWWSIHIDRSTLHFLNGLKAIFIFFYNILILEVHYYYILIWWVLRE